VQDTVTARKLVVALGDESTAKAEEGVTINLQFATDELQAHCAVLPTLPNGIDLILGNDFLSTYDILIRPARAEYSWFSEAQNKHLVIHGCSTIMSLHSAPHRDRNHIDGRADQLRHHILTLGTQNDSESGIEIVSSVELGKRLRLFREKAQNKRMKNPELSEQDILQDEVAYVLTTAFERSSVGYNSIQRKTLATAIIAQRTTRTFLEFETPQVFFIPKMRKMLLVQRPRLIALAPVIRKD
jgi:hypothetical protein